LSSRGKEVPVLLLDLYSAEKKIIDIESEKYFKEELLSLRDGLSYSFNLLFFIIIFFPANFL
jgi:hypothetical protein